MTHGERLAKRVNELLTIVLVIACIIFAIGVIEKYAGPVFGKTDSTDAPEQRSGMRLHTDHMTGCQYLSVAGGGIAPRLGRDGNQICGKESE